MSDFDDSPARQAGVHDIPRDECELSPDDGQQIKILSLQELENLPDADWLVREHIPKAGISVLYGPFSTGKTFLALDMALCIACGRPWCGYEVEQGVVVYIAAESAHSIQKRVAAWRKFCTEDEEELLRVSFKLIGGAVQLPGELDELLDGLCRMPEMPVLVIIDTLARCTVGMDENSARDMGLLVDACDAIRLKTGAAVLVVHHRGWGRKDQERGSSALASAADARVSIERKGNRLTVRCRKQKDASDFEPLFLCLEQVELGSNDRGERLSSCRVVPVSGV